MEHYFYNFSRGVDVYNSLKDLHRDHNSTSFLISAVGDLSKVSFKCPLNDKPLIFENNHQLVIPQKLVVLFLNDLLMDMLLLHHR